ncbi:hypothetical protein P3S67_017375 [Capsicum chacoense]
MITRQIGVFRASMIRNAHHGQALVRVVTLSYNQLFGPIPSELAKLKKLNDMLSSYNQLFGPIPSELGKLQKLNNLGLSNNQLSGPIPKIGYLRSLMELVLSTNSLKGSIPAALGDLNNLSYLHLDRNLLSGPIPAEIGKMKMSDNNLSGEIPLSICNLTSLQRLFLSKNNLMGEIPQCIGNMSGHLGDLDMQHNYLSGTLPITFNNECALRFFNLNGNELEGRIPRSLANCTDLLVLNIGDNRLKDAFPTNNLEGAIPQCFGNMLSLEVLDMQHNNLSGTFKSTFSIRNCYLRSFNLNGNKLEGRIPRSLENCQRLEVVDLGDNLLNDTFPMWLGTLPKLQVLSLRSNKLHGPFRTSRFIKNLFPRLQIIDLASNAFSAELPVNLFQNLEAMKRHEVVSILSLYTAVDFSSNRFEGDIPGIMGDLIALRVLKLSHNELEGPQFATFEKDSYTGNDGLRGFPVSEGCGRSRLPETNDPMHVLDQDSNSTFLSEFDWKVVLTGFACGLSIGFSIAYFMLSSRNPNWLSRISEELENRIIMRMRKKQRGRQRHCRK